MKSKTCDKLEFESFFEAQHAVNMAEKKGRAYGKRKFASKKPKRVYKCEICGKYHLTTKRKKI